MYSLLLLKLGTKRRLVVSCIPWLLYHQVREETPGTHWIGGWVGPTAALVDILGKTEYFVLARKQSTLPRLFSLT